MEPIRYEFNQNQFIQFLKFIGFLDVNEKSDNLWRSLANKELSRVFNEGYPYCESKLVISPSIKEWEYCTTSKTILRAYQKQIPPYGEYVETSFRVFLPSHRENGFTYRFLERLKVNPDFTLFPEWEMLWSEKETEPYKSALIMGLKPYCDRVWEELPRSEKKKRDLARYEAEKAMKKAEYDYEGENYDCSESAEYDYESEEYDCSESLEEYSIC